MIVVIQCAATKVGGAALLRKADGDGVVFVAEPAYAPSQHGIVYARPDDRTQDGPTWREALAEYNNKPSHNPLGLLPAFQLYSNDVYRALVARFGLSKMFILSAGWGLISASFLTPYYDITFSAAAEDFKRRKKRDRYQDFCQIPPTDEEIVFVGGKDYLPLFCALTAQYPGTRTVFYNSESAPTAAGCALHRFHTTTRTNWHYECARHLLQTA